MKSNYKCSNVQQADVKQVRSKPFHRWLKRKKNQIERRRAIRDPEVLPCYRRYCGWES